MKALFSKVFINFESSIISKMVSTVVTIVTSKSYKDSSERCFKDLNINNIISVLGEENLGYTEHSPYDVIILLGTILELDKNILKQLGDKGRLIVCHPHNELYKEGRAYLYTKIKNNISKQSLFDITLPNIGDFNNQNDNKFLL